MKWKIMFLTLFLIATAATITIATPSIITAWSNLSRTTSFASHSMLLDGEVTPTGGGDPLPGGGIPK